MINQVKLFSIDRFRASRRLLLVGAFLLFGIIELLLGSGILINYPFLIALPVAPMALLGFLLYLEYGAILLLFCMLFVQLGFASGTETIIPVSLVVLGVWALLWLVKMALDHQIKLVKNRLNIPALVFMGVTILALFWSRFFVDPQLVIPGKFIQVQLATIAVTAASIMTTILCANLVRQVWIVKACFFLIIVASLIYLPLYFYDNLKTGGNVAKFADPAGLLSVIINAGGLFSLWICALCAAYLLFAKNVKKWHRAVVALVLALWLFRLGAITLIRISSWVPVVVALLVILFIYSRKWFFTICLIGLVTIVLNFNLFYDNIISEKADEGTLSGTYSRQSLFVQALEVGKDHLLLGTGPAGYRNYYITYYPDVVLSTHNNYLDMFLQYGVTGLIIFFWLLIALLRELWAVIPLQKAGSFEYAFTIGCLAGAIGMIVGMLLGDWVIPFAYNQTIYGFSYTAYNWIFPGLSLALGYIARTRHKNLALSLTTSQAEAAVI